MDILSFNKGLQGVYILLKKLLWVKIIGDLVGFVWRPEATGGRQLPYSFRTTLLRIGICWINVSSPAFAVFHVLEFMILSDVAGNLLCVFADLTVNAI